MRIGLLSDTHLPGTIRTLWEEVKVAFKDVDLILHGGDIVTSGVLDWLEQIAPVLAAVGNNDVGWDDDSRCQHRHVLDLEGWRLGLIHDMEPEDRPMDYLRDYYFKGEQVDIIVTGHTHRERIDYRDGVLQINSGQSDPPPPVFHPPGHGRDPGPGAREDRCPGRPAGGDPRPLQPRARALLLTALAAEERLSTGSARIQWIGSWRPVYFRSC